MASMRFPGGLPLALLLASCYDPKAATTSPDAPEAVPDAAADASTCDPVTSCTAVLIEGVCFFLCGVSAAVSLDEARDACTTDLDGCVATLTRSQSDSLQLFLLSQAVEDVWIGLVQPAKGDAGPADGWQWTCDGEILLPDESDWAAAEPNDGGTGEDCAILNAALGWNDRPCSDRHPWVCQAY
jgi:hypothetical protein